MLKDWLCVANDFLLKSFEQAQLLSTLRVLQFFNLHQNLLGAQKQSYQINHIMTQKHHNDCTFSVRKLLQLYDVQLTFLYLFLSTFCEAVQNLIVES